MRNKLKRIWKFIYKVFDEWIDDKAPKLGASLSFYTMFSIAPLLIIIISIAGLLFGAEAARGEIIRQIEGLIGRQNGDVEQRHHRFKRAVAQELLLRGSRDFGSVEEYERFLQAMF